MEALWKGTLSKNEFFKATSYNLCVVVCEFMRKGVTIFVVAKNALG